ncbi:large terminase protein [uncultured Caudovirales phage]|uniref:Large terminase protein n=1 Tax=uncultured Caudovirales phage TaxID=2100421 RepID=A0A6J5M4Q1_9CAUD|nr:large terminase protein [uncultured Caudovirales phage]
MIKQLTVQGFTPTTKQREIIDACLSKNIKYIIGCFGRQAGKSFTAMNLLLKWVLEDNGAVGMWVSPVYSQAKKVFTELTNTIAGTGLTKSINKSELTITFINGSVIYFRSGEREDTLRGYTLNYLVVDEAAYIKDEVWNTVLRPTVLVNGKKVLFISTPKGRNWFYNLAMRGMSDEYPTYKTFFATSFDTPFITAEELEEAKMSLPETIYKQEILAEFIDDGGEVFGSLKSSCILDHYPNYDSTKKYYAGLDFGRQNDYTVLTILNSEGEMVDFYRERQKSWDIIISEVVVKLKKWRPICFAEVNSIGDVLYEQIKKQYPSIQPFITSSESKQNMVEDLIMGMNESKIKLPSQELNTDLYKELSVFTYEYSPKTRKIKYGSPNGFHDDTVISLALSYHSFKKKATYGTYVVR